MEFRMGKFVPKTLKVESAETESETSLILLAK